MTAPGNSTLLLTLLAVFVACTGYAAGRLHQSYLTGQDRDAAYREGYDIATRSVVSLAARVIGPRRERAPIRASAPARPSTVEVAGRHTVPDELVRAATYRLTPDRVARAKVREVAAPNVAARDAAARTVAGPDRCRLGPSQASLREPGM